MTNMVFLEPNKLLTLTMANVPSNTLSAKFLLDKEPDPPYITSGSADDSVSAVISIVFPTPTLLDVIALQSHNLKQFRIFYDSLTANVFAPAIAQTTNSATNSYFSFATQTVASVQIQMDKTMDANDEKEIGEIIMSSLKLEFERNPASPGYNPIEYRKQIRHEAPNGGISLFTISDKFRANFRFGYVTKDFRDDLRTIWKAGDPFYFVPFPESTAWDGAAYEVVWPGNFDFKLSDNPVDAGFSGSFTLEETP